MPWGPRSVVPWMNEEKKEKTTSKGQPKNRAKSQTWMWGERETRNEKQKHRSWSMMMKGKSPENVASIQQKAPIHFLRGNKTPTQKNTKSQKQTFKNQSRNRKKNHQGPRVASSHTPAHQLLDLDSRPTLWRSSTVLPWSSAAGRTTRRIIENVFAIDVAGTGCEGCAFVSAGVTLFETVELYFCADGFYEAHNCCERVFCLVCVCGRARRKGCSDGRWFLELTIDVL